MRTLTALYDTKAAAEAAQAQLKQAGIDQVSVHDQGSMNADESAPRGGGFMASLKDIFGAHEDHHAYAEGLNRGRHLLTAKVDEAQTDRAFAILEGSGAIDFDAEQAEWKGAGWTAPTGQASGRDDDKIQIAEERLVVGKREVERGGVRVRSYVVETPVHERVDLREENVSVERHAVNRAIEAGTDAFQERTIEMHETAEEAVIGKQAVVTEELTIRKNVGQRTQEIDDTVRHTEVEVEPLDKSKANPARSI